MGKKRNVLVYLLLLALLGLVMVGCSGQTMAEVNGEKITKADLEKRMEPLKKLYTAQFGMDFSKKESKETLNKLEKSVLEQMVTEKLILQAAAKNNVQVSSEEVKKQIDNLVKERFPSREAFNDFLKKQNFSLADLEQEIDSQLLAEKLAEKVIDQKKIGVSEEEAKKYFQNHQQDYNVPELVKARHILVKDKKQAEDILKKLQQGQDFAQLAKTYSQDPGSKDKGGDLGYFSRGQMVPAFEKAAFSLKIGQISSIIQTDYGYHIIKVEDHKQPQTFQFQQLREEVKKQLEESKKKETWMKFLADLRSQGKVKINM